MNNRYADPGTNVVMKTYHVTFTIRGKQECLPFVARSQEFAMRALERIYAGTPIKILYAVCDDVTGEEGN